MWPPVAAASLSRLARTPRSRCSCLRRRDRGRPQPFVESRTTRPPTAQGKQVVESTLSLLKHGFAHAISKELANCWDWSLWILSRGASITAQEVSEILHHTWEVRDESQG